MPLPDLRAGYDLLYQFFYSKPSKYGSAIAKDAQSNDIDDALPGDLAPPAAMINGAAVKLPAGDFTYMGG